jgi:hypothetical protein
LAGRGEDRAPPTAGGVEALRVLGQQFNGDMDETIVKEADDEAGFASHRGMGGVARETKRSSKLSRRSASKN